MSIIEASSVRITTMADGTLRMTVDIEPRNARAGFELFGAPGTALALTALKPTAKVEPEPEKESPGKGGELSKLAARFCKLDTFYDFIRAKYSSLIPPEVLATHDQSQRESICREEILHVCGVTSRKDIDNNDAAKATFHREIRLPFIAYLQTLKRKT